MFKKKPQSQQSTPAASPSMESMPPFIRSPVVPRFNSPFPPLHPDKKYKGVYERAGFDVYKGSYANRKHSHDINHPSECNSMGPASARNSPSPNESKNFPRNFTAPNPFGRKNHKSDPNLTNDNHSTNSLDNKMKQRNFSESTTSPYTQRPQMAELSKSSSSNNFNYVSAYSTPVVDSNVGKNEDIKTHNYIPPVKEQFDQMDRNFEPQQQDYNNGYHSSPERSFHSAEEVENTYNSNDQNAYQQYSHTSSSHNQEKPTDEYGLNIRGNDPFKFGHESVTSTYPDDKLFTETPHLSQLIEEEIGATPKIQMPTGDFEGKFYDSLPNLNDDPVPTSNNEEFISSAPQIIVEENYDYKLQTTDDVTSNDAYEVENDKRPTMSTYINRDQAYDLLTGGDIPSTTPDIPSGPQFTHKTLSDDTDPRSYNSGPEDDFDNTTDHLTATTSSHSYDYSKGDYNLENEIESMTKNLGGSYLYDSNITPEMKQELDGKFVHHKILSTPIDLEENTKPLGLPQKATSDRGVSSNKPVQPSVPKYPPGSGPCRRCNLEITGKSIWSKDEQLSGQWHRNCFSCHQCLAPFTKGTNCYVINDFPYCEQHFHELNDSICKNCGTGIEGTCLENEKSEKFHPRCLSCQKCGLFIDKDYFVVDGLPLCEADGLIEIENEKNLMMRAGNGLSPNSRIEKRRTRLLQI